MKFAKYIVVITALLLLAIGCKLTNNKDRDTARAYELFNKALEYNLKGLDSLALPLYDSAIILAPNEAKFYTNRGITKYELGDTLAALTDYYKAIELDSMSAIAYLNIGVLCSDKGDYKNGLKYAEKVLQISQPHYAYYNIGYARYMLGDYQEAIDAFLSFLENYNFSREDTFYLLGNSYAYLEDKVNAQLCWDKANELAGYDIKSELDKEMNTLFDF